MRVLFDQGTPVPLRRYLRGHQVTTAYELRWSALENGQLVSAAEADGFEVLVTTDRNLKYQQNLTDRRIAIAVLLSTSWPRIEVVQERVVAAVDGAATLGYVEVEIP